MKTIRLKPNQLNIAASILSNGGIVAIPTETVYGLAANALNVEAVKKIFKAKSRPIDNPIIVHISNFNDLHKIVDKVPEKAKRLIYKFWPGPLTIIFKKSSLIPHIVTGGLKSVAVRMPRLELARKIIDISGPFAAPSANISGKPSAVTSEQVLKDLEGKIDAIIEIPNFSCEIGIESTVIDIEDNISIPTLLRPGMISPSEIENVIGKIKIDDRVTNELNFFDNKILKVISPGLKYKHYSPNTNLIILRSSREKYIEFVNKLSSDEYIAFCFDEDLKDIKITAMSYGPENNVKIQAFNLYTAFIKLDNYNFKTAYVRINSNIIENEALGVYNRILRAASFRVKDI